MDLFLDLKLESDGLQKNREVELQIAHFSAAEETTYTLMLLLLGFAGKIKNLVASDRNHKVDPTNTSPSTKVTSTFRPEGFSPSIYFLRLLIERIPDEISNYENSL